MTNYKLIYFNVRGRAELSRLILHCAEVPFEDYRIEHSEWLSLKQGLHHIFCSFHANVFYYANFHHAFQLDMPFRQIPVLVVDDGSEILAQSNTIARYLAKRHGLAGKDDWERSQADMFIDCVYDLHAGKTRILC